MKTILMTLGTLALALGTVAASPADDDCPDVKATQVEGTVKNTGESVKCSIGFTLFGYTIGLSGEDCPEGKIRTPAHQVCNGDPNEGTKCVPDGDLPVTIEKCSCASLTIPGVKTGLSLDCKCEPAVNFGTVEDFKTEEC